MKELIKIEEHEGKETVNARDLHEFLESKQEFSHWIKKRIEDYFFVQGTDFIKFDKIIKTSIRPRIEYALSIDMAKELSMIERNSKGKQARLYFIEMEKQAKGMSQLEMMRNQLDKMIEQEKQLKLVNARMDLIEARQETSQEDFYTVAGYCSLIKIKVDLREAAKFGKSCKALSDELEYKTGKAKDPRFGTVNTYHLDILREIIG